MPAEIVTIAAGGFAGPHRSMQELERSTGLTTHYRLSRHDCAGEEIEFYIRHLRDAQPRIVLFGGWCELYGVLIRRLRRTRIRFGVWWLSTAGQTDMSREMDRLVTATGNPRIEYHGFAQRSMAEGFAGRLQNSVYLPVPMFPESFPIRPMRRRGPVVISLFCSPHEYHRKNILNTLLALSQLNGDYVLALNGLSRDRWYRALLQRLDVRYEDSGWMTPEAYRRRLDSVDIGVQVSFTESFNQVAAEHALRSIPVIGSEAVPSLAGLRGPDRARLIVNDPEDPAQIAARLNWLIRHPKSRREIGQRLSGALRKQIGRNNRLARNVLTQWLNQK